MVSGSQQGASELSATGVQEGTESADGLGDGSLKEAIDMEGPSGGSPDFEKVPDINDFEDEDEDDSNRVYDMGRDVLHHSSFPNEPQNMEPQGPTSVTAPGMSLSNTSGEMSMPEAMMTKTRKVSNLMLLKHLCIPRSLSESARTLAFKLRERKRLNQRPCLLNFLEAPQWLLLPTPPHPL
ncbi:hypothetical protein CRENBAI_006225 [Crenichthys baileyi]|uniref:Uncharacterized protein n=1 Tax=Crenichthys baileyi TaxID=28760 RepID=A0AAV9RG67_9TELE